MNSDKLTSTITTTSGTKHQNKKPSSDRINLARSFNNNYNKSALLNIQKSISFHHLDQENNNNIMNQTTTTTTNPCSIVQSEQCEIILANWNYQIVENVFEINKEKKMSKTQDKFHSQESTSSSEEEDNKQKVNNNGKGDESDDVFNSRINQGQNDYFNYQCLKVINGCSVSYYFRLTYEPDVGVDWGSSGYQNSDELMTSSNDNNDQQSESLHLLHFKITPYQLICPQPVNLVVVGSSAFFIVLLLGLLTICVWKILTLYWDRRDYERFMTEVQEPNFTHVSFIYLFIFTIILYFYLNLLLL